MSLIKITEKDYHHLENITTSSESHPGHDHVVVEHIDLDQDGQPGWLTIKQAIDPTVPNFFYRSIR